MKNFSKKHLCALVLTTLTLSTASVFANLEDAGKRADHAIEVVNEQARIAQCKACRIAKEAQEIANQKAKEAQDYAKLKTIQAQEIANQKAKEAKEKAIELHEKAKERAHDLINKS